jgi:hypothetical protein
MERRKPSRAGQTPTPLPADFLRLVTEVFTSAFEAGLKALREAGREASFEAGGDVYPDEVLLWVSLVLDRPLAATTVYASADFDLELETTPIERLHTCVDAAGALFQEILTPEFLESPPVALADPARDYRHWTPETIKGRQVHLRADATNPRLERMADEWLATHDPAQAEEAPEKKTRH